MRSNSCQRVHGALALHHLSVKVGVTAAVLQRDSANIAGIFQSGIWGCLLRFCNPHQESAAPAPPASRGVFREMHLDILEASDAVKGTCPPSVCSFSGDAVSKSMARWNLTAAGTALDFRAIVACDASGRLCCVGGCVSGRALP